MAFKKIGSSKQPQAVSEPGTVEKPAAPKRFKFVGKSEEPEFRLDEDRSAVNALLKGVAKGGKNIYEFAQRLTPAGIAGTLTGQEPGLPIKFEKSFEDYLNEFLPSQEGFTETVLEKAGEAVPFSIGGGPVAAVTAPLISGLAGAAAREADLGPAGETIAEIAALGLPGLAKKAISPTTVQKPLVEFARRMGLSEEQIAPAIQKESKRALLSRVAHKGPSTVKRIQESAKGIGAIYQRMSSSPEAQKHMAPEQMQSLLAELSSEIKNLPAQSRKLVQQDALDLIKSPPNAASLMNFYQDVNHYIGKGSRELGGINRILNKNIETLLGEDFKLTNELYRNLKKLGSSVRPDLGSKLHDFRQWGELAAGISGANPGLIKAALGEIAGRRFISGMLTKPRMQNMTKKFMDELKKNKIVSAEKVLNLMINESQED